MKFITYLIIYEYVRKEVIPALAFLVFFLFMVAFIMNSAFSMTDEMDGDTSMFRIMFFGVGAFMVIVAVLTIFSILRKRPAVSKTVSGRLIDQNRTEPQADYCPVCHANMGRYDKCPECGFREGWR